MHFWKYCGAGNDFVILENFDGSIAPERYAALAAALCREHFSVGADGLMVLEPPAQGGDCRMRFYNRDGSTAEMCGNGARCLCRHCHDRGLASGPVQRIETPAGLVTVRRIAADRYRIRLNRPSVVRLHVEAEGVRCAYLELGEPGIPHAVVLTELDRPRAELRELAARLRSSPAFPRGANVNLCAVTGENRVRLLTFERGVEDFTLACGTGTGATVAALARLGLVSGGGTQVQTDGGLLSVDLDGEDIDLTGPAELTFTGDLPELPA